MTKSGLTTGRLLMKTRISVVALLLFAGIAAVSSAQSTVDHGREVYAVQKCALCHSISGIGGKKLPLDGVGSRLKAEDIRKWIRTPKEMKPATTMKPYPNLPEKDLSDLTAFLMTLR
jgi:mono/diheme cytochrome c family protein